MPKSKPDLRLDDIWDDDEIDVGTVRTSFSLTNVASALVPDATPVKGARQQHSKRASLGWGSPSSPSLLLGARKSSLSRSQTLPRTASVRSRRPSILDSLSVDTTVADKIRRWILGIAVVNFDIDHGPVVDGIYPPLFLYPDEIENIAFSSFPDSAQFEQGAQAHSFRIREDEAIGNEKRPPTIDGFIYGFAHFSQRKDASIKRGYQQRSVVILTHHQYPALFAAVMSLLGPLYEEHGVPMLESACHNIATWPPPTPGSTVELGFLGNVVTAQIPRTIDEQQALDPSVAERLVNASLQTMIPATAASLLPPAILLFEASLPHIWSIWECLVLNEPILLFGASPAETSQAVWWLRDLMRPIPLAGDIRPYFTIHDRDHLALVNKLPPKSGLLLGVTNPFFERSCAHWPHILSLGYAIVIPVRAIPGGSAGIAQATAGPRPGWKTKTHKRYVSKDRSLLKQLETACEKGGEVNLLQASLLLRRHFCTRTTELLLPLSRYLNTLIPTPAEVASAHHNPPPPLRLKPFNTTHFFASLKAHGTTLPFRSSGKRVEFYERWLKTPAFGLWLAQQEEVVIDVLSQAGR
uniref:UDENN domain-containing protein n=1 Tax=Schizophyllum commune (strain H4-8 / FGSC 9210) TaxID=578458 RepID=D8PVD3_SCHCM